MTWSICRILPGSWRNCILSSPCVRNKNLSRLHLKQMKRSLSVWDAVRHAALRYGNRSVIRDLNLEIAPGERRYAFEAGPETEGSGEFQQEAQRIVGEMPLQGIQGKNAAFRPFEKTVFVHPVADGPHQDFRHKKCHTVFLQIAPDAVERGA